MTEELTYRELVERLGEPLTERHVAGTTGVRADNWPCGCLRLVKMRLDAMSVEFVPCQMHQKTFEGRVIL